DLGATRFHQLCHALFGDLLPLHLLSELARDDRLDGSGRYLFPNPLFFKPAFEARPYVRVLAAHACISFNLCLAVSNSTGGVLWVSLMNACTAISASSWKPNNTRASRLLGSDERTSHKPPPNGRHSGKPTGHPN